MKRVLIMAFAAAVAMAACQKMQTPVSATGDALVSVTTTLPAQLTQTRVAGDGTTADRCIMEIYLDGKLYGERQYADVQNLKATFSARLVTGETYDLVFWADKKGADLKSDLHYNTADLGNVTFAEGDDYLGNDDARDAFFGTAQVVADQSKAISVELRRPFGQLNVKTLDMAEVAAAAASLVPARVKIAFDNIHTGINLLSGELTETTSAVAYAEAMAPANNTDNAGELTFDYVFAPKTEGEQYLADFTMSFLDEAGAPVASDYEFSNIPVQRNYRTNVSGNLLTKKADINVTVVPEFDGTTATAWDGESLKAVTPVNKEVDGVEQTVYGISEPAELAWVADQVNAGNGALTGKYFELANDIDLGGHAWSSIGNSGKAFSGTFDGNGYRITGLANDLFGYTDNTVIRDLTVEAAIADGTAALVTTAAGTTDISSVTVDGTISGDAAFIGATTAGGVTSFTGCENRADISSTYSAGAYVSSAYGDITITDCRNSGDVVSTRTTGAKASGFVATVRDGADIVMTGCENSGNLSAESSVEMYVAGFACWLGDGSNTATVTLRNCTNNGAISGVRKQNGGSTIAVGGLIATCWHATAIIEGCANNASVTATNEAEGHNAHVGGIIGMCNPSGVVTMTDVTSNGPLYGYIANEANTSGVPNIGGLIGQTNTGNVTVNSATITANVTATYSSIAAAKVDALLGNVTANSTVSIAGYTNESELPCRY